MINLEMNVWYQGDELRDNEIMNYIKLHSKDLVFELAFEKDDEIIKEKDIMYKEKRGFVSITKERVAKAKIKEFKMYYDSIVSRLDELCDENIPTAENPETINEWERNHGRGFWGNMNTGYVYDKDAS